MSAAPSAAAPRVTPLVDAHAHIFTADMPLHDTPRHRPAYDFTVEDYLSLLDAHGVRYGVIAAASPWADYNDYTIDCVRKEPRLRGTVIVKPDVERYILERMKEDGIVGIRLPYIGLDALPDVTGFEHRRLFRRLADLDMHIHLHVEGRRLPAVLPALMATGARIVIDHLGRPDPEDGVDGAGVRAILDAATSGRLWVKASCAYRIGPCARDHFLALLERLGPERFFWASDAPFVGHESEVRFAETIDWLAAIVDDAAVRDKIFGANAHAFYFR